MCIPLIAIGFDVRDYRLLSQFYCLSNGSTDDVIIGSKELKVCTGKW